MTRPSKPATLISVLARQRMMPFLILMFGLLHPGDPPLEPAWYLRAICRWLERVAGGELKRAMIWLQPRTLKSFTVAIVFPCWVLGINPSRKIVVATYGEKLSLEHADKRRQIMDSALYRRLFPKTRIKRPGTRGADIQTTAGGYCNSVSVGGPVTGRGGDLFILDDCMKADDQDSQPSRDAVKSWFTGTFWTRRNNKVTASMISIQQRIHEDDLPALLLEKGFEYLSLPAIAPNDMDIEIGPGDVHRWKRGDLLDPVRFPMSVLDEERLTLGPRDYSAQYLQNPVAPEGNLLKMEQFRRFEQPIARERFDRLLQSWDPAASELPTADWTVCTTWGFLAGRIFLLEILRQRMDYPTLKRSIIAQRRKWQADHVIIERSSNGLPLCQQLGAEGPFRPVPWPPSGLRQRDKAERLIAHTGQIEEGRVWLPATLDGLDAFLSELRAFPNGRYDDQVDTLTQLLEYLFWHWKALYEVRMPDGRLKEPIRGKRPPLPPVPDFIR